MMYAPRKRTIICSGDSFTAGDELAGDELIPGYTSMLHFDGTRPDEAFSFFTDKYGKKLSKLPIKDLGQYIEKSKARAWPSYIQKLTEHTVINVSQGGISNQEIVHRVISEVNRQLNNGVDRLDIYVMVMLTSPARLGIPISEYQPMSGYQFASFMPTEKPKSGFSDLDHSVNYWFKSRSDEDMLWESFCAVAALKQYLNFLGIKCILLDSCLFGNFVFNSPTLNDEHYKLYAALDIEFVMGKIAAELNEKLVKLPGGHYIELIHSLLAKKLIIKYF